MSNKENLKVGMICCLKAQGNEERCHKNRSNEEWLYDCEIVKVGRKYFEIKKLNSRNILKYNVDDLSQVTNYCSDWKFYFSKQEALDDMEYDGLVLSVRSYFSDTRNFYSNKNISLDQLRRINSIMNENK